MNKIEHLIISSTMDYSTDLICAELNKRGERYLRLNRDLLSDYEILCDLGCEQIMIDIEDNRYIIDNDILKSVYFRAPVFLRDSHKLYSLNQQVYRSQWSSFLRNLLIMNKAKWINSPMYTYRAENKMYQLKLAREKGFLVPHTFISNVCPSDICEDTTYVVKSLDTALFCDAGQEMFTYTSFLTGEELRRSSLNLAPVFIQEYLSPKIDIRATIIGNSIFAVKILEGDHGIKGDWRTIPKENLKYVPINLPPDVIHKTIILMNNLQLKFGGMDLILHNSRFYFIEVNPTGEWGWLVGAAKQSIDLAIVDCLTTSNNYEN